MCKATSYYINSIQNANGPSIFGARLKNSLAKLGWQWKRFTPDVSFIFSSGFFRPFSKNILRLDGLYFDSENVLGESDKLNRPIFNAYRNANGIIFQSEFARLLFSHFVHEPTKPYMVIPNGVPHTFSPEGEKINYGYEKTILCSAKWRSHKRLECIIEGFLEYSVLGVGLVVIGDGIEKRVEHPNIKYIGRVPPQNLPKYLRGGDAFIHLTWLDNCPNTVVEALACGLPILCSHNGGTKELVKSNGVIIKCEEDYEFKKVKLYDPPRCDRQLVAEGIDRILAWDKKIDASHLDIENIARRYAEFSVGLL